MNTIKSYTGAYPLIPTPLGFEPSKEEMAKRIHILEGIVQAIIDHMGKIEEKELGPMEIGSPIPFGKFTIYEAPLGTEKHIPQ